MYILHGCGGSCWSRYETWQAQSPSCRDLAMCIELKRLKLRYFLNVNRAVAMKQMSTDFWACSTTSQHYHTQKLIWCSLSYDFIKPINNSRYTASNSRTMHLPMKVSDLLLHSEEVLQQVRTADKVYGLNGTGSYFTPISIEFYISDF
jgi:hypothetical protein